MFAVIKTGGKQYKVASGDTLRVEKLAAEAGERVQFNEVLVVGDEVGAPLVAGAAVQATVIDQVKGEKLIHFVRRRRKHSSKRTKGHRQQLTLVRVTDILATGGDATGVKAAVGTAGARVAAHEAAPPKVLAAVQSTVAEAVAPVVEAMTPAVEAVAEPVREAAKAARGRVGAAIDRVEHAAETAIEAVTDAVEDVTSSRGGRVALAAGAAAAVAAIAAAVILPATSAEAEPSDDSKE